MIKFIAERDGKRLLGIVLLEENIIRLRKKMPILFKAKDMELPSINADEVLICFFKTEGEAIDFFTKNGLVKPEQIVVQR